MNSPVHQYARASLVSLIATAVLTTILHLYELGPAALPLGLVLVAGPILFLLWFRATRRALPLIGYSLMALWLVVGFGIVDGLWKHTFKIFIGNFLFPRVSDYFAGAPMGSFPYEATGILVSIASLFAAYFSYRFITAVFTANTEEARIGGYVRWIIGSATVLAVIVGGTVIWRRVVIPDGTVIKIGVTIPMQGPGALLGNSFLKAVQLAQEDLGNTRYRYELVIEDSGTTPEQTARAIQKLIYVDKVRALLVGISKSGEVVKPYATAARVPQLCVCSVQSIGDAEYNFTNIPAPEDEGVRWVAEAQRRGIRSVGIMAQSHPSVDGHIDALKAEAAKQGIRIVYENHFDPSTTDFRKLIARAREAAPDVFMVESFPPSFDLLGQQLRDAGVQNIASIVAPSISQKPELFEGVWYTDSNLVDPAFRARFESKYPDTRFATHMMPYAYDSFNLLVRGFESRQHIAEYVRHVTEYDGTAGKVTRDPSSGNFRSAPAVWVIKQGRPELLYGDPPVESKSGE